MTDAEGAFIGYTLFAPMSDTGTYLINNDGELLHSWESDVKPALSVYLEENGHLLKTANLGSTLFTAGGSAGGVREYDWDGNLVWSFEYTGVKDGRSVHTHHDVERLPDGNLLMIAWEEISAAEADAAGRNSSLSSDDGTIWSEKIIEVDPSTDEVVWHWRAWDHLVQEYDPSAPNYGDPSDHPERVDLNYTNGMVDADWLHFNSVDYNAVLDQVLISVKNFNEVWIIDHSVNAAEASGSSGGNGGKGGDLLYRWGNPAAYGMGDSGDQQLYSQHDARWIEDGYPGGGNILVFNNGDRRLRAWSSVVEIVPPVDGLGGYERNGGSTYGPDAPIWEYSDSSNFYADHISGSSRLANGNTLICDGTGGRFFEVDSSGMVVWEYANPVEATLQGPGGGSGTSSEVFRAEKYGVDFAGFAGRELTPGGVLGN